MKRTNKALLLSFAFHAALLSGLAMLKPWLEPGIGASPRYVEVAILDGLGPTEAGFTAPETDTPPATDGGPEPERVPDRPEAPQPTQTPRPAQPAEPEDRRVAGEPDGSEASAPPARAADADAVAAGPDTRRPAGIEQARAQPPEPVPSPSPAPSTAQSAGSDAAAVVVAAIDVAALPAPLPIATTAAPLESAAVETPDPPRRTEAIAPVEAALIEERIEDWAESFAALGDWRTDTSWIDEDAQYTATVSHLPSGDDSGYDEAVVTISTTREGRTLTTEVRMQRLGFSHYAQFIDRWDPQVQIHDDIIDGRFHSNSDILINRGDGVQPTFLGKVTTARNIDTSSSQGRIRRDQIFLGGLETRVGRIAMPGRISLFDDEAPEHVLELARSSRLRFYGDGSYSLQPILSRRDRRDAERTGASPDPGFAPTRAALPQDAPFYVVAAEDAEIRVAGTVNGRVLIYSPEDIVIEDDLVLAAHPLQSVSSDDYLGLVTDGSIEIAEPDVTGPGDVEVHAAIYARRQFAVRGIRSRRSGELRVIGSVTAGSVTATEPRFSTRLIFDQRLAQTRPPGFPLTDLYEIADWDGRWTVTEP